MRKIILFFKKNPTHSEKADVLKLGMRLRDPDVSLKHSVERCDFVCGDIPANYKKIPRFSLKKDEKTKEN